MAFFKNDLFQLKKTTREIRNIFRKNSDGGRVQEIRVYGFWKFTTYKINQMQLYTHLNNKLSYIMGVPGIIYSVFSMIILI